MKVEKLQLNKKFLVIESPIPFEIFCPEQNDGVKRRQGSWQMTIHDLLTKSHYPLNPIYNLELIYDETLLNENETVSWYTTDLNLGEALRGIDGQLVTLGDSVIDVNCVNLDDLEFYSNNSNFARFEHSKENSNIKLFVDVDSKFLILSSDSYTNGNNYYMLDNRIFRYVDYDDGEYILREYKNVVSIMLFNNGGKLDLNIFYHDNTFDKTKYDKTTNSISYKHLEFNSFSNFKFLSGKFL